MPDNTTELEKILKSLTPTFKEVTVIKNNLLTTDYNNLGVIKDFLLKLTAHYATLKTAYGNIKQLKTNKELAYYYNKKFEIENKEPITDDKGKVIKEKFVSESTKEEARFYVASERKVRDITEGYMESTLEEIRTCRNLINEQKEAV